MTKRKRSSQLIAVIMNEIDYMQSYPEQMVETADVHLVVDGRSLPVHSFVLMASSPFFSELVSASLYKHPDNATHKTVEIPIEGIGEEGVRYALCYLYREMQPGTPQETLGSTTEAEHVAKFGHKFHVQVLQAAADKFLQDWLTSEGFDQFMLTSGTQPKHNGVMPVTAIHGAAINVIDWALFAERFDLPATLQHCTKWLAEHFCEFAAVHKALFRLSSKTILRVMWNLSKTPASVLDHFPFMRKMAKAMCDFDANQQL